GGCRVGGAGGGGERVGGAGVLLKTVKGLSGRGSSAKIAFATGLMRSGQITFKTPLHCIRGRLAAFAITFPAASSGSYKGTIWPDALVYRRKSPLRKSAIGREIKSVLLKFLARERSPAKKKKLLFRPS